MTHPILIQGLGKSYSGKPVLEAINLAVPTGSVLGLLGKNGAGKSTLIKCMLGLIKPDIGACTILGEPAWELSDAAKSTIGYVPQSVTLPAWMRVAQVVEYTASFYPRWNDKLVSKLLVDWDVDEGAKASTLSLGTQQKLTIILALGHEPSLLILDEPAASLDPSARREFLRTLLEIAGDTQRTILFSTHITSDLERVADSVAILRSGRLTYVGELGALKDEIKRLHLTSTHPLRAESFSLPGLLQTRVAGNTAVLSVRGLDTPMLTQLQSTHAATIRVEDLNLEDIFLEMHHD